MRLYPPAWTTGRAAAPRGDRRRITFPGARRSCWPVGRPPRPRWFPTRRAFDPDRWLPERAAQVPRHAYFPFGGGPRVCIGNHFAMMEAILILACLARRVHLKNDPVGPPLELVPSITLRPRHGVSLIVHNRERVDPVAPRPGPHSNIATGS